MGYSTSISNFVIREATSDDRGLVLSFIKELAEYEKLAHEVTADEALLDEHLFGEQPCAEVLIGEYQHRPVGFALFFQTFSTFLGRPGIYLEDLFVRPEYRGQGFGKALLCCLAKIALDRDCGRLDWAVLDWNQPAIDFYNALGARQMNDWIVNRVTGKHLQALADQFG